MILASVHYRLFEGEEAWYAADEPNGWHQLDGEVWLQFVDAPPVFVSWAPRPVVYAIESRTDSYFDAETLHSVELSSHPWWRELIGREMTLRYADRDHQVLCIETGHAAIFLSSQYDDGMFNGDCVRVSPQAPAL